MRDTTLAPSAVALVLVLPIWVLGCTDHTPPTVEEPEVAAIEPARFVVKTRENVEVADLTARLASRFGPGASAQRLFEEVDPEDDPDGMMRMFRIAIPKERLPSESLWESAYALEELDLEQAEPDLNTTLEQGLEATGLCFVDDPPPDDRAWSLSAIRAVEAWTVPVPSGGRRFGEGVLVCHPDTGWAEHVELDAQRLDLVRARNLLEIGLANGQDPLDYQGPLLNPGHGTGTGSVIVSKHENGEVLGVAPRSTLIPIRTAKSVVQVFDSALARAVNYSVDAGCDIVSMSLGGRAFFGLEAAIHRAVRNDVIVAAAAGNCVRFVVAPAAYRDCLAIAATNVRSEPWRGSSRGRAVDVSAPGEHVWAAVRRRAEDPTTGTTAGQGTSFAVANVAGAAALWLAYHGREALNDRYAEDVPLQEVFRALLRSTARPTGAEGFGAGILDVEALLKADLPPAEDFIAPVPEAEEAEHLALLSAIVDRPPGELAPLLAELFDTETVEVEERLRRWGPELIQVALADPPAFDRLLRSLAGEETATAEPAAREALLLRASPSLRGQLR